jgi:hypothetical protein
VRAGAEPLPPNLWTFFTNPMKIFKNLGKTLGIAGVL